MIGQFSLVLDESSLVSTRQMHNFLSRLHRNDRGLLVGDVRQHEGVEAGRPFAQLQEAGMHTVKLDQILRQRDPELKEAVEMLARGHVAAAIESLDVQGRVHEVIGRDARISAIARSATKFGSDLATAQRKRGLTVISVAERMGVSKNTYLRAEKGDPGVGLGVMRWRSSSWALAIL